MKPLQTNKRLRKMATGGLACVLAPVSSKRVGWLANELARDIRTWFEAKGSESTSVTGKILIYGCSTNLLINGTPAARASLFGAECKKDIPLAPVAEGSSNVFINQQPAARKGDKIQCGATISNGSDNVIIDVAENRNSEVEQAHYDYDLVKRQTRVTDERNLTTTWDFGGSQQVTLFEDVNRDVYRIAHRNQMPIAFHLPGERNSLNRIAAETDPLRCVNRTGYRLNTL